MRSARSTLILSLMLGVAGALTACGDDDDGSAARLQSCKLVCEKFASAACLISIPVDTCNQLCDAHAQTPVACQDALKVVSDCQLALPDICMIEGCDAEEEAYHQACSK